MCCFCMAVLYIILRITQRGLFDLWFLSRPISFLWHAGQYLVGSDATAMAGSCDISQLSTVETFQNYPPTFLQQ